MLSRKKSRRSGKESRSHRVKKSKESRSRRLKKSKESRSRKSFSSRSEQAKPAAVGSSIVGQKYKVLFPDNTGETWIFRHREGKRYIFHNPAGTNVRVYRSRKTGRAVRNQWVEGEGAMPIRLFHI